MNPSQLYEFILNAIQPPYEKEYGIEHRKDVMNVSGLVGGTKSYLYKWREREKEVVRAPQLSFALLRGKAIHFYISKRLEDMDAHEIRWKIPFDWKDGTKDITLLGHYDNTIPVSDTVLAEWKTTGQDSVTKNGLLIRAKRQAATYGTIMRWKTGRTFEVFIVILNTEFGFTKLPELSDLVFADPRCCIFKLTPDDMKEGFEFVKRTAYEVARELDIESANP